MTKLVRASELGELVGADANTVRKWRLRFDDFPERAEGTTVKYPYYYTKDFLEWYERRWPERAQLWPTRLFYFEVGPTGSEEPQVSDFGPRSEAIGYLRAIRDIKYDGWTVWFSRQGFVADRDGVTHIWHLDWLGEDPEEWFIYEQQLKAAGKRG